MNPVTGPYSVLYHFGMPYGVFRQERVWYRQRKPYDLPLPYLYKQQRVTKLSTLPDYDGTNSTGHYPAKGEYSSDEAVDVVNKALARLQSKIADEKAGWLINIHQRRQALDMMSNRLFSLAVFATRLKQSTIKHAFSALVMGSAQAESMFKRVDHLQAERRFKTGAKHFANNFLELHFGWEPLIKDIYATMDVLSREPPPQVVRASASARRSLVIPQAGYNPVSATVKSHTSVRVGAKIRVVNENLFLAEQLGVINPASVIWDAIPWSFLVGWISNVSQFVGSFTDYAGLEVTGSWHTVGYREDRAWEWIVGSNLIASGANSSMQVERKLGLPPVTLRLKPLKLSPTKALTAVSLLLQQLK